MIPEASLSSSDTNVEEVVNEFADSGSDMSHFFPAMKKKLTVDLKKRPKKKKSQVKKETHYQNRDEAGNDE